MSGTQSMWNSIEAKVLDGWSDERLSQHYNWVNPNHLALIVRRIRRAAQPTGGAS